MSQLKQQAFNSVLTIITFILAQNAFGAEQGPFVSNTFYTVAIPGAMCSFNNMSNVKVSDDIYASSSLSLTANGDFTNYFASTNYGFSIPNGSTIRGIEVHIERSDANVKARDNSVRIIKGGAVGNLDKSKNGAWPSTDGYVVYGDSTALWGETWTTADINAANFGVALSSKRQGGGLQTCYTIIDHICINVYYDTLITLPIELSAFSAVFIHGKVNISWTTDSELNSDYFVVERSFAGTSFQEIATAEAQGFSNTAHKYEYADEDNLQAGITYYRLHLINADQTNKYFPAVSVRIDFPEIILYPNPNNGSFEIQAGMTDEVVTVEVINKIGELLFRSTSNVESSISIYVPELQEGLYFLQLRTLSYQQTVCFEIAK